MSRPTITLDSADFTNSIPKSTGNSFTDSFNDSKNDFNRARDAITTAQKVGIGIGVTVAVLAIISVVAVVIMITRKNRRRRQQMEQNEKMYEHHRIDPSPDMNVAVYGSGGVGSDRANGYEMAGKSELGGAGVVGEQYSSQVQGTTAGERTEMDLTTTQELSGGERRELGGQEVRGVGNGGANGGNEEIAEKKNGPAELQ